MTMIKLLRIQKKILQNEINNKDIVNFNIEKNIFYFNYHNFSNFPVPIPF